MQQVDLKWCRCLQDRKQIRKGSRDRTRTGLAARRDEEKLDVQFSGRQV